MTILAIDPGTFQSGVVELTKQKHVKDKHIIPNDAVLDLVGAHSGEVVIEMIDNYGLPIGKTTMETLLWIGRFYQACWVDEPVLIARRSVRFYLCGTARAGDASISTACKDRYAPTGGGMTPQVGIKSQKGPLYGLKSHMWAALAVGLTFIETGLQYEYKLTSMEDSNG